MKFITCLIDINAVLPMPARRAVHIVLNSSFQNRELPCTTTTKLHATATATAGGQIGTSVHKAAYIYIYIFFGNRRRFYTLT